MLIPCGMSLSQICEHLIPAEVSLITTLLCVNIGKSLHRMERRTSQWGCWWATEWVVVNNTFYSSFCCTCMLRFKSLFSILLSQSGLIAIRKKHKLAYIRDNPEKLAQLLAQETPFWEPGWSYIINSIILYLTGEWSILCSSHASSDLQALPITDIQWGLACWKSGNVWQPLIFAFSCPDVKLLKYKVLTILI